MKATARKLILTALAILASGTAVADDYRVFAGPSIGLVAELSAEERAMFRDRWQQLPPDQREAMRYKLRQDWADQPPEVRPQHRRELMNKLEQRRDRRWQQGQDNNESEPGYGQGYGTRPWDGPNDNDAPRRGRR
ncbi:MAG: hypothetical protein PHR30_01250 [Gallionellaceae bacterium]|nr:hypothetical protein [Gallionellaceae bacterium]